MKNSLHTPHHTTGPILLPTGARSIEQIRSCTSWSAHQLSETLVYQDIQTRLLCPKTSDTEKRAYIKTLQFSHLEQIFPLLEQYNLQKFHTDFIDQAMESMWGKYISRLFPYDPYRYLQCLFKDFEIPLDTWMYLIGKIGTKDQSLTTLLPYIKNENSNLIASYFLRAFLAEQSWDEVQTILPTIPKHQTCIGTESIMKIHGFLPFDEIVPFLMMETLSVTIKEYLLWKCESPLHNQQIFSLLSMPYADHFSWECLMQLSSRGSRTLSMSELETCAQSGNMAQVIVGFILLSPDIWEPEKDAFFESYHIPRKIRSKLFPYRPKTLLTIKSHLENESSICEQEKEEQERILPVRLPYVPNQPQNIQTYLSAYPWIWSYIRYQTEYLMTVSPQKSVYAIYREIVRDFLSDKQTYEEWDRRARNTMILVHQKARLHEQEITKAMNIGIDTNAFELTLYIRYQHRVDYPEIAELIGIFIDAYISWGYSRYFSNFRILPRNANSETPIRSFLDSLQSGKYYNVIGIDSELVMHTCSTCMFLSHSANTGKHGIPNIISATMRSEPDDIVSKIELESRKMWPEGYQSIQRMEYTEILREVFQNPSDLESQYDTLIHYDHLQKNRKSV